VQNSLVRRQSLPELGDFVRIPDMTPFSALSKKYEPSVVFESVEIGSEEFSCSNSEIRQEDCGQEDFRSRKNRGFALGGEREIAQTAEPVGSVLPPTAHCKTYC